MGFLVDGETLLPGGSIIVSGKTYSLPPGATSPVILSNGLPILTLPDLKASQFTHIPAKFAPSLSSGLVIDGKTLTPGGIILISGTTYSFAPGETSPVIISGGIPLLTLSGLTQSLLSPNPTTFKSQVSGFVIDGVTISPGSTIVVSGTTYSLPPGATAPVILSD